MKKSIKLHRKSKLANNDSKDLIIGSVNSRFAILKFWHWPKKRLIIFVSVVALIVIAAGFIYWRYLSPQATYATIGGQKITKAEYNDMKSKLNNFYSYSKNSSGTKNLDKNAQEKIIEDTIIIIEAKNRGITATDQEVNVKYTEIIKLYKSEAEYKKTIASAYNWTTEDVKNRIKIDILKEKLKAVVLKGYDVSFITVRYDMGSDENKEDPGSLSKMQDIYNRLKSGASWVTIINQYKSQDPIYVTGSISGINAVTKDDVLGPNEDWVAIQGLGKVGDYTKPTKSGAGYYVIYRADKVLNGTFNTWGDFITYYTKKYVSYNPSSRIADLYKLNIGLTKSLVSLLTKPYNDSLSKLLGEKVFAKGRCAFNLCPFIGYAQDGVTHDHYYHPGILRGRAYDAITGLSLPNARITIVRATSATATQAQRQAALCNSRVLGNSFASGTIVNSFLYTDTKMTDSGGIYRFGDKKDSLADLLGYCNYHTWDQMEGIYNPFSNPNNPNDNYFMVDGPDCHWHWKITATLSGYNPVTVDEIVVSNGAVKTLDIPMTPISIPTQSATISHWAYPSVNGVAGVSNAVVGNTVQFNNGVNVSNVINTGSDKFRYSVTGSGPNTGEGSLSSNGTAVNDAYSFIPTTPGVYCRRISTYWAPGYVSYANANAEACVTVAVPSADIVLGASATQYAEPGEQVAFTQIAQVTGATNTGFDTFSYSITDPSATSGTPALINQTIASTIAYTVPSTAAIGSQICREITITAKPAYATVNGSGRSCVTVVSRPVVHFSGADVATCNNNTGIYTYAKNKGVYYGSGTQYAAIVQGLIDSAAAQYHGFISGNWGSSPKALTFANTSGTYGGGFGGSITCDDYYNETDTPPAAADLHINAVVVVPAGSHNTVYVNGNAYINSNIIYASWGTNKDAIPSYRLIVKGNIYISPGVNQLNGFYFARGKIYTCSSDGSFPGFDACRSPLTVFGALQANNSIKWWRTTPTMNTNVPAENIIFSPEMYFSQGWSDYPTSTSTTGSYSDMQSLPPVF